VPRLKPLPPETTPELKPHFDFFLGNPADVVVDFRQDFIQQVLGAI